jgi:hypothetical protein
MTTLTAQSCVDSSALRHTNMHCFTTITLVQATCASIALSRSVAIKAAISYLTILTKQITNATFITDLGPKYSIDFRSRLTPNMQSRIQTFRTVRPPVVWGAMRASTVRNCSEDWLCSLH